MKEIQDLIIKWKEQVEIKTQLLAESSNPPTRKRLKEEIDQLHSCIRSAEDVLGISLKPSDDKKVKA